MREKLDIIKYVFRSTFRFLIRYPRILIPFIFVALFNIFSLFSLYLWPMYPFRRILGPPITHFFGRQYLHYPYNFILLPKLFSYVKNFVVNPLIFSLMVAIAVGMAYNYYTAKEPSFFSNFNKALRRYIRLVLVMIVMVLLSWAISKIVSLIIGSLLNNWQQAGIISYYIGFFAVVAIESLFAYSFLAIMVKNKNIIAALKESFLFSKRTYFITYILVLMPRLLDLLIGLIERKQLYFMNRFIPDITLLILVLGIIMAIISDCLVYCFISNLYILKENSKNA